jgi:hypothetical protein
MVLEKSRKRLNDLVAQAKIGHYQIGQTLTADIKPQHASAVAFGIGVPAVLYMLDTEQAANMTESIKHGLIYGFGTLFWGILGYHAPHFPTLTKDVIKYARQDLERKIQE